MVAPPAGERPSIGELRRVLIPARDAERWDDAELPRAVLHLDDQAMLARCEVLLGLAVVERRSLEPTRAAGAVALGEVLVGLLPKELDHPYCCVLRALAGLEQGTAGRRREQRQEVAGRALGPDRYPMTPRAVRRRVQRDCWPWLLDRLIEHEVAARRALEADERGQPWVVRGWPSSAGQDPPGASPELPPAMSGPPTVSVASSHHLLSSMPGWPTPVGPMLWWSVAGLREEPGLAWLPPALPPASEGGTLDDDMKRRTFLGIPAAWLLSRSGLSQPLSSRAEAATLNETTLDELAAAVTSDARLHDRLGSRAVHGLVTEHVRLTTELLRGSPPAALRSRLAAIASEAAAEAGLVCYDQRQLSAAQSYKQLAAELAREAGDPLLEAYALGSWSRKLAEGGDGAQALSFVERAQTVAKRRPSSAMSAYLAVAAAEAEATLRDADASLRALDRADKAMSQADRSEDPPWLLWLEGAHFVGWKGYCLMRVGRLDDADLLLAQALSAWDPSFVRDRAIILINLALVRLREQELDECCGLAAEAIDLAVATGSPRVVQRVRDLRLDLQPWSESSGVKALDEQMVAASWM